MSASADYRQLERAMWLDDDTLAVLELRQDDDGDEFRLLTADAAARRRDAMEGVVIRPSPSPSSAWPRLAGVADDGSILVAAERGRGTDAATSAGVRPGDARTAPGEDVDPPGAGDLRLVRRTGC